MTLDWNEHDEAREEFLDAHEHYLGIEDGRLGDEFVDATESAAELILRWPDAAPPNRDHSREPIVRSWHLGKFPYRLIYTVLDGEVYVLAYAHEARRPGYWSRRLSR